MLYKQKITKQKCTETAIVLAAVLLFLGWKYEDWQYAITSFVILVLSLLIPMLFYPIAKLWFALGSLLGFISTKVLLSLIFITMLTPIGVIRKLIGKDSLHLKSFKTNKSSVLKVREHQFSADDLKTPY